MALLHVLYSAARSCIAGDIALANPYAAVGSDVRYDRTATLQAAKSRTVVAI